MRERPILFSGPMVRALLDGRKTQTRRVIARFNSTVDGNVSSAAFWETLDFAAPCFPDGDPRHVTVMGNGQYLKVPRKPCRDGSYFDDTRHRVRCRTEPGDHLWVKETFAPVLSEDCGGCAEDPDATTPCAHTKIEYRADGVEPYWDPETWKPSIFMPRWASRLTLEVTAVRVERVQGISEEAAKAEGVAPWGRGIEVPYDSFRMGYQILWDSINGKRPGCAWADNPWVWVVEFRRIP